MRQVETEQIVKLVRSENPWWEDPDVVSPYCRDRTPRAYLEMFYPMMTNREVRRAVVLMGPRRVGKTVMLHHAIRRLLDSGVQPRCICYISIENPLYNGMNLETLRELYAEAAGIDPAKEECYFIIDEIQYMKEWERYLKSSVDRFETIRFVVSGSAAAALRRKSNESGAGRFTDFLLPPLTFYEYLVLTGYIKAGVTEEDMDTALKRVCDMGIEKLNELFVDYINFGGYPEVALSKEIQKDQAQFIRSDVIEKVLLRDLPSLYGISDVQELNRLFTVLVYNTGQEVSLEELSKNSSVAKNTVSRYIEYLEAAFLIRRLHRVDQRGKRFQRATHFKVYVTNPSMWAAMFGPAKADDQIMGSLVETALLASITVLPSPLYYARWKNGEVDFVLLSPERLKPTSVIEAKWSDRYPGKPEELKSLFRFCLDNNLTDAIVTTRTREETKTINNISVSFLPAAKACLTMGKTALSLRVGFFSETISTLDHYHASGEMDADIRRRQAQGDA